MNYYLLVRSFSRKQAASYGVDANIPTVDTITIEQTAFLSRLEQIKKEMGLKHYLWFSAIEVSISDTGEQSCKLIDQGWTVPPKHLELNVEAKKPRPVYRTVSKSKYPSWAEAVYGGIPPPLMNMSEVQAQFAVLAQGEAQGPNNDQPVNPIDPDNPMNF